MIVTAIILCCVGLFVILCRQLESRVDKIVDFSRQTHERISRIEDHENEQDQHLYAHDSRIDRTQKELKQLKKDVNEMGKDIGWSDDDRKTQVMKQKNKDPDDAA